ncbi:adenosylcobinamide-phosphate synthase [Vibrio nigripulchritudo]|uniref:cobalamin biosynthesis family protein n=1 Tax=Vibrio nigripulchritudo TaxID=28173 RepID=UPI00190CD917|nr:cobalamin biosynthesis family protein [Vibrio nigripulchritudo]BCL71115.1 adenosylcobinamide-phosphate synthase [Vibrio nigripulchritudo]BDU32471.1 adenosylcobinamide-phosphate synthase [Vibrio nigripulchritudo]
MEALFTKLYSNGALLVLWGALLFHFILPIPKAVHPATLWHKFAELLASKVNNNQQHNQSMLSGSLAWALMCFPALVFFIALRSLVWQPQLFDLALLLLAIDWRSNESLAKHLMEALNREDKKRARRELAPHVNRVTKTLSPLGLGKAGAETLIMGYGRNVVCVLFWYAIGGGIGAFMYRLIMELARAWSPSRSEFLPFGVSAIRMLAIIEFIPLRLFSLLVSAGKNMSAALSGMISQGRTWPTPGPGWLMAAVGNKLELSLGGPAIYGDKKTARPKLGGRIAPSSYHLSQIQHLLAWRICVWVLLQSLIMAAIYQGV